jgi:hypothetical protein
VPRSAGRLVGWLEALKPPEKDRPAATLSLSKCIKTQLVLTRPGRRRKVGAITLPNNPIKLSPA